MDFIAASCLNNTRSIAELRRAANAHDLSLCKRTAFPQRSLKNQTTRAMVLQNKLPDDAGTTYAAHFCGAVKRLAAEGLSREDQSAQRVVSVIAAVGASERVEDRFGVAAAAGRQFPDHAMGQAAAILRRAVNIARAVHDRRSEGPLTVIGDDSEIPEHSLLAALFRGHEFEDRSGPG